MIDTVIRYIDQDTRNTRVIDMTVGELLDLIKIQVDHPEEAAKPAITKNYEYGIAGIARIFGCSRTTACRIKASGVIDAAIVQTGRTIVVDPELALQLMKAHKEKE